MRPTVYQGIALILTVALLGASGLRAQAPPASDARPRCPVCELWSAYSSTLDRAQQEVGPLPDGVIYFYHSKEPSVIEPLIRFAYERDALTDTLRVRPDLAERLGRDCGEGLWHARPYDLKISTSAHGFFAILTSDEPQSVKRIRSTARIAVPTRYPVRF